MIFDLFKNEEVKIELTSEDDYKILSDSIQDDYDELIKYGFKNVDYFKSIVRADKYFAEHPLELQKYHIILKGNQNVHHCCFFHKWLAAGRQH